MPRAFDRLDDGPRAGPKTYFVGEISQPFDFRGNVERAIEDRGQAQLTSHRKALAAHRLLDVLDDDFVNAFFRSLAGLAETDLGARKRLQLQRDVLEDMAQISAGSQALKETAALADAATMLDHRRHPSSSIGRQKPGNSLQGLSKSPKSTHASNTGKLAQIFGPRSAKTLRNSIAVSR